MRIPRSIFAALLLIAAARGRADAADLSCALASQGSLLRWSSSWQADGEDNDVSYRVQRIVDNKSSIFVELNTAQAAVKPVRFFTVEKKLAESFCNRLFPKPLTRSAEITTVRAAPTRVTAIGRRPERREATSKLPFIRYTPKGWVRSDPPDGRQLNVCEVHNRRFACLPEEQEEFASALRSVELELSNTPK